MSTRANTAAIVIVTTEMVAMRRFLCLVLMVARLPKACSPRDFFSAYSLRGRSGKM